MEKGIIPKPALSSCIPLHNGYLSIAIGETTDLALKFLPRIKRLSWIALEYHRATIGEIVSHQCLFMTQMGEARRRELEVMELTGEVAGGASLPATLESGRAGLKKLHQAKEELEEWLRTHNIPALDETVTSVTRYVEEYNDSLVFCIYADHFLSLIEKLPRLY